MPRPERIQFEHAAYHVMNRGRAKQYIFHTPKYYLAFLSTLEETHDRFDAIIHAYCLMGNHYHLFVETPRANLDRIMRHINGVYTQRYNRLKKTDGPLFRGRYKAILVDRDEYMLQLTRYIHRNPIDTTRPLVNRLEDYPWSSYPAYVNKEKTPRWLNRETTYCMLGQRQKYAGYKNYVEQGVDDDTKCFYHKGNTASVFGGRDFRNELMQRKDEIKVNVKHAQILSERPSCHEVISVISKTFNVSPKEIIERKQGRQPANLPRKFAIYACQQYADMPLKDIASTFSLKQAGSVSPAIRDIKELIKQGKLREKLTLIESSLNIKK